MKELYERGFIHKNFHPENLKFDSNNKIIILGSEDFIRISPNQTKQSCVHQRLKNEPSKNIKKNATNFSKFQTGISRIAHGFNPAMTSKQYTEKFLKKTKINKKCHQKNNREKILEAKARISNFEVTNDVYSILKNFHFLESIFYPSNTSIETKNVLSCIKSANTQNERISSNQRTMHNVNDLGYLSPETVFWGVLNQKSNYFSVGVLCYEMIFNKKPYKCGTLKSYIDALQKKNIQILKDEIPEGWSLESADFVNRLLQKDPTLRLGDKGLEELFNHPWIKDLVSKISETQTLFKSPLNEKYTQSTKHKLISGESYFSRVFKTDPDSRVKNLSRGNFD